MSGAMRMILICLIVGITIGTVLRTVGLI